MATFFDNLKEGWNRLADWAFPRQTEQPFRPEQGEAAPPPRKAPPRPPERDYEPQESRIPYREEAADEAMGNVLPFPGQQGRAAEPAAPAAPTELYIYYAQSRGDCEEIINLLLQGRMVALNLEQIDDAECQRVIDLVSGATFSLRATVNPLSYHNYLLAPAGVTVQRNSPSPRTDADVWGADDRYDRYDRRDPYDRRDRRSNYGNYGQEDPYARNRRYAAR
jgi:FtsZ-interacting cell division protein YlmF